jgi:hypothetical protein
MEKLLNCLNCGLDLNIDCGDAEPNYNNDFCSVGCYDQRVIIELSKQNIYFLEDVLINQLELFEKENDKFSEDYCNKINQLLKQIR